LKVFNIGKIYFVPTPIGNLKDFTYRAVEVLNSVDIIYAEDTRSALKLLNYLKVKKRINSLHKDNERKVVEHILDELKKSDIAVISEAGTPGISDPGNFLAQMLVAEGIDFEVLPGANAIIPALVKSGYPTDSFYFAGFLSHKKKEKIKEIEHLATINSTIVIYESPHRLKSTLELLLNEFDKICVLRELTKIYEEKIYIHEKIDIESINIKGEFVIVVDNNRQIRKSEYREKIDVKRAIKELIDANFSKRDVLNILKIFGYNRNEVYEILAKVEQKDF